MTKTPTPRDVADPATFDPETVTTRYQGTDRLPAVNVKVRRTWSDVIRDARADYGVLDLDDDDGGQFLDWLEAELANGSPEARECLTVWGQYAETDGWEAATERAAATFAEGSHESIYVAAGGRMGGWLIVYGLGAPDTWALCRHCAEPAAEHPWRDNGAECSHYDPNRPAAIAGWATFAQWAHERAQDTADDGVRLVYLNVWRARREPVPVWHPPVYTPGYYE